MMMFTSGTTGEPKGRLSPTITCSAQLTLIRKTESHRRG
ncbi:hypothetical protein IE985_19210 [Klebsiella pneumoniae]|nr:hypothetical protein [Klebsiella pneumoniae]